MSPVAKRLLRPIGLALLYLAVLALVIGARPAGAQAPVPLDSAVSAGGGLAVYWRGDSSTVSIVARTASGMWSAYRWPAGGSELFTVGLYGTQAEARASIDAPSPVVAAPPPSPAPPKRRRRSRRVVP